MLANELERILCVKRPAAASTESRQAPYIDRRSGEAADRDAVVDGDDAVIVRQLQGRAREKKGPGERQLMTGGLSVCSRAREQNRSGPPSIKGLGSWVASRTAKNLYRDAA